MIQVSHSTSHTLLILNILILLILRSMSTIINIFISKYYLRKILYVNKSVSFKKKCLFSSFKFFIFPIYSFPPINNMCILPLFVWPVCYLWTPHKNRFIIPISDPFSSYNVINIYTFSVYISCCTHMQSKQHYLYAPNLQSIVKQDGPTNRMVDSIVVGRIKVAFPSFHFYGFSKRTLDFGGTKC